MVLRRKRIGETEHMTESKSTFSLVDEPWIQVELVDGEYTEISIREVFDGSQEVRSIKGESAAQDYAVFRVLLAIYWRAHQPEATSSSGGLFDASDWVEKQWNLARELAPDEVALEYLQKYADRFDLLHPEFPFMQVAGLEACNGQRSEIRRITPDSENNYFSMRAGKGNESLSFAEAARWLIYVQAYDYSGIKTGCVGDPRVKSGRGYPIGQGWTGLTGGTLIHGKTLRESLVLNTPVLEVLTVAEDKPVWERDPDLASQRGMNPKTIDKEALKAAVQPKGAADLLTWQSRRIRLFAEDGRVRQVTVGIGDKIPDAGANVRFDPMTPYRFSKNKSRGNNHIYFPQPYGVSRTLWRAVEPLLAIEGDLVLEKNQQPSLRPVNLSAASTTMEELGQKDAILDVQMVSVEYGPQASTVHSNIEARLGIPAALVPSKNKRARRAVLDAVEAAHGCARALGIFAGQLRDAAGAGYEFQAEPVDSALKGLEPEFVSWLRNFEVDNHENDTTAWHELVREFIEARAQELLRGAGPQALVGRYVVQGEEKRFVSAGTSYRALTKKLRSTIPKAYPEKETEQTPMIGEKRD